jgi:hypothetical protein
MAVRIAHAGYDTTGDKITRLWRYGQLDALYSARANTEPNIVGPALLQQRFASKYKFHSRSGSHALVRLYIQARAW